MITTSPHTWESALVMLAEEARYPAVRRAVVPLNAPSI
jgi:hypothetical protein